MATSLITSSLLNEITIGLMKTQTTTSTMSPAIDDHQAVFSYTNATAAAPVTPASHLRLIKATRQKKSTDDMKL